MPTPGEPIPIDNQVTVTQIRAQWSTASFGVGESSWSFIQPAANDLYLETALDAWQTYIRDLFCGYRPLGWTLNRVMAQDRWPNLRPSLMDDTGWEPIPTTTVRGLPPQCTPVISWRTGVEGRSNRGRTYWGPCRLDHCEWSNVINEAEDAITAFAEEMLYRFTGATFPSNPHFAIVSRVHDGAPVEPIGTYLPVIEYRWLARYGVQRRRLDFDWRT